MADPDALDLRVGDTGKALLASDLELIDQKEVAGKIQVIQPVPGLQILVQALPHITRKAAQTAACPLDLNDIAGHAYCKQRPVQSAASQAEPPQNTRHQLVSGAQETMEMVQKGAQQDSKHRNPHQGIET